MYEIKSNSTKFDHLPEKTAVFETKEAAVLGLKRLINRLLRLGTQSNFELAYREFYRFKTNTTNYEVVHRYFLVNAGDAISWTYIIEYFSRDTMAIRKKNTKSYTGNISTYDPATQKFTQPEFAVIGTHPDESLTINGEVKTKALIFAIQET